jgi:Zn-dependent M16 (insulinase) family peptidase
MTVPCCVSKQEHAAILVLIEIFSRTEGPLYTRIRGKGLAYGCSIYYSLWYGQLVFDCSEVSDPFLAVNAFWDVLKDYTYTDFDAETAKAGVLFRLIEAKSTVGGLLYTSLRNALRVFFNLFVTLWKGWGDCGWT